MSDSDDPIVQRALDKISAHMSEIARLKQFVNQADKLADRDPRFPDTENDPGDLFAGAAPRRLRRWNPGDFYGESFSGAVRKVLTARKDMSGSPSPASVDEIHAALNEGSFKFDTSGSEQQKNSIRISLGKNSAAFVKLPNSDVFGLVEWYGAKPGKPSTRKVNGTASTSAEGAGEVAAGDAAADPQSAETEGQ